MTFRLEDFELFFLILVRISTFMATAPFFSLTNVPLKVKSGLSIFIALLIFYSVPGEMPTYGTVVGFAILVVKEALVGIIMGFLSNLAYHVLAFAGQIIDMEIGFSMVNTLDPISKVQSTITSSLYGYLVLLMMIITDLHLYILRALVDSFQIIGVGAAVFRIDMYRLMIGFMTDYYILGFRIILPVFAAILLVNAVLAILAKISPQMNMFVIGMQLKVFVGLAVLVLIIKLVPSVADGIFNQMIQMLKGAVEWMR